MSRIGERGSVPRDGRHQLQRTEYEAREAPEQAFPTPFGSDLEVHQIEAARKPRAEQAVQVRGDATDRLAARPEQQDDVALHAAFLSGTWRTRGARSTSAFTPSDS